MDVYPLQNYSRTCREVRVAILYNSLDCLVAQGIVSADELEVLTGVDNVKEALTEVGVEHSTVVVRTSIQDWLNMLLELKPDVVFNLCEAVGAESRFEMNVACVLELSGVCYTGSPPLTLGICQNKVLAKIVLASKGILTPKYCIIDESLRLIGKVPPFPVIVKPVREDGSVGIHSNSVAKNRSELEVIVQRVVSEHRQPAIVEEYIDGRELNVAILGNSPPELLPISEIIFSGQEEFKIVSYDAKWSKDSEAYRSTIPVCPTQLDNETMLKVSDTAVRAYNALGCRDYARIDIRLKDRVPYVLEVNPNPDISHDSGFKCSLDAAGIKYSEFVGRILSFALQRKSR